MRTLQLENRSCSTFPLRFARLEEFAASHGAFDGDTMQYDAFLDSVQARLRARAKEYAAEAPDVPLDPPEDAEGAARWRDAARVPTPWHNDLLAYVSESRPMTAFDTLAHPVALVLGVSAHEEDPLRALQELSTQAMQSDVFARQAFLDPRVLRCYVVLDRGDGRGDPSAVFEAVRRAYGLQVALLPMHDPARAASATRTYVRELVVKSLVPYLERTAQQLNEQVAASRRGFAGRLWGAGRRLLNARTAHEGPAPEPGPQIFTPDTPEAQTRRLADLAFWLRDYKVASSTYDAARRAFQADGATRHAAAAAEMLLLTRLLHAHATRTPAGSLEPLLVTACDEYLGTTAPAPSAANAPPSPSLAHASAPPAQLHALRTVLLYSEVQHALGNPGAACAALAAAGRFSDEVLSAVLLDAAATSLLRMQRPHSRKAAAMLVMSASQFQACGHKALAHHGYARAAAYFGPRAWRHVADHVVFQLALEAHNDGRIDEALAHLVKLLHTSGTRDAARDADHLAELVSVYTFVTHDAPSRCVQFETPLWDVAACHVVAGSADHVADPLAKQLARMPPSTTDSATVGVEERFAVRLCACNPFNAPITVSELALELAAASNSAQLVSAEHEPVEVIALAPYEETYVSVYVRVLEPGHVRVARVRYMLEDTVHVEQTLDKRGRRLTRTREQRLHPTYAPDTSLAMHVRPAVPRLVCTQLDAPAEALMGECIALRVRLQNEGGAATGPVRVACSPGTVWPDTDDAPRRVASGARAPDALTPATLPNQVPPASGGHVVHAGLAPGDEVDVTFHWLVDDAGNAVHLRWLFAYEDAASSGGVQHTCFMPVEHVLHVEQTLSLGASAHLADATEPLGYTLQVEAHNVGPRALRIEAISVCSPRWEASPGSGAAAGTVHALAPAQSTLLTARLARSSAPASGDALAHTLMCLRAHLAGGDTPMPPAPPPVHVAESRIALHAGTAAEQPGLITYPALYAAARSAPRRAELAQEYAYLPASLRERAFPLLPADSVDVLVHWASDEPGATAPRTGQCVAWGVHVGYPTTASLALHHELLPDNARAPRAMYAQTAQEKRAVLSHLLASPLARAPCPLSVHVEAPPHISHAFAQGPRAVQVAIRVVNEAPHWPMAFSLRLLPAGASGSVVTQLAVPWLGRTMLRGNVAPYSVCKLDALVLIPGPGLFQLGDWQCEASVEADGGSTAAALTPGKEGTPAWEGPAAHFASTGSAGVAITAVDAVRPTATPLNVAQEE